MNLRLIECRKRSRKVLRKGGGFFHLLFYLFFPFFLLSCHKPSESSKEKEGPSNVIVVVIDTARYDHFSFMGYMRDTTPNIDFIAANSVIVERVYSHSNWTVPSVASILSSLYPSEHGAGVGERGKMRWLGIKDKSRQPLEEVVLATEYFKKYGYSSLFFSANPYLNKNFAPATDFHFSKRVSARKLTDLAIDAVDKVEQPFFLYIQYMDPHHPLEPPQEFVKLFAIDDAKKYAGWRFGEIFNFADQEFIEYKSNKIKLYDATLRYVDSEIRRLFLFLRSKIADNFIFLITTDHGEEFWDHVDLQWRWKDDPRNIYGIGHGHTMFEELVRSVIVIGGKGINRRNVNCIVSHIDIMPTLAAILNLPKVGRWRGANFLEEGFCEKKELVFIESPAYGPDSVAVVDKSLFKFILRGEDKRLLFNLKTDPKEKKDVSSIHPGIVDLLQEMLKEILSSVSGGGKGKVLEIDDDLKKELEVLGYL